MPRSKLIERVVLGDNRVVGAWAEAGWAKNATISVNKIGFIFSPDACSTGYRQSGPWKPLTPDLHFPYITAHPLALTAILRNHQYGESWAIEASTPPNADRR